MQQQADVKTVMCGDGMVFFPSIGSVWVCLYVLNSRQVNINVTHLSGLGG